MNYPIFTDVGNTPETITPEATPEIEETQNIIEETKNIAVSLETFPQIFKGNINEKSYLHPDSKPTYGSYQINVYSMKSQDFELITNPLKIHSLVQLRLVQVNLFFFFFVL